MSRRIVAITGATGFIGSHVAERLRDAGWRVRALVRPESRRDLPNGIDRAPAHLRTAEVIRESAGAELVIHLAGLTTASRERHFTDVNMEGTRQVAAAASGLGARLVHVSSLAVAGPRRADSPASEDDRSQPLTPYAASKLAGEIAVQDTPNLRWTIVRPAVVYGPRDVAFLPLFRLARRGVFPVVSPATSPYTLVYVDDVVDAIVRAAEVDAAIGQTFFIGHPEPVTKTVIFQTLATTFGRRYRPIPIPRAAAWSAAMAGECVRLFGGTAALDRARFAELAAEGFVCSSAKARSLLGVEARIRLEDGFSRTARWYRDAGWVK